MEANQERKDLAVTQDLQQILNILKPTDAEAVLALKEELADNWNKRQILSIIF